MVTTERMEIVPLSDGEMLALIAGESDPEMRQAYTEMRQLALAHPEERLWYTAWQLRLRCGGEARPLPALYRQVRQLNQTALIACVPLLLVVLILWYIIGHLL